MNTTNPIDLFYESVECPDILICGSDFDIAMLEKEVWE